MENGTMDFPNTWNRESKTITATVQSTFVIRDKGPWKLIFRRNFEDKSKAIKFESELKKLRNKNFIKEHFQKHFIIEV